MNNWDRFMHQHASWDEVKAARRADDEARSADQTGGSCTGTQKVWDDKNGRWVAIHHDCGCIDALITVDPDIRMFLRLTREIGRLEREVDQSRERESRVNRELWELFGVDADTDADAVGMMIRVLRAYREQFGEISVPLGRVEEAPDALA